jgi:2'-5' RNA ligase
VSRGPARLFFAAWPGPAVQHALFELARKAQRECGGRAVAERKIHLTLAFLGSLDGARAAEAAACADRIRGRPCDLAITRLEYWRHNRILWAGVEQCPEPLVALASHLSAALRERGFLLEDRPYVPHITLLREARRGPAGKSIPPVAWPVRELVLVESLQRGAERLYEVAGRWPLMG